MGKKRQKAQTFNSFPELGTAVANREISLSEPAGTNHATITTKAGKLEYDSFFRVFSLMVKSANRCSSLAKALAGQAGGIYFLPLGFIPGPAILLSFDWGKVQIMEATPDVKERMKIPTPWQKVEKLPAKIQEALKERRALVKDLGYEPSPWNMKLAQRVLEGRLPARYLAMAMAQFRYRPGDPERPLGVVLIPVENGGMEVLRVYNPSRIPDVPTAGTVLTFAELKDNQGPIQKILRTWALMESNYHGRYGNRH